MAVAGFQQHAAQPAGNESQRVLLRRSANRQRLACGANRQRAAQIQCLRAPQQNLHHAQRSAPQAKRVRRTGGHQAERKQSAQRIQPVCKCHSCGRS